MPEFSRQQIDTDRLPQNVLEKWSRPALAEGFVPFPKKLLRGLTSHFNGAGGVEELAVVLAVADFKRPNLTRLPSLAYLAFLAGLDEEEFKQALSRLERKGYVRIRGRPEALDVDLSGLLDAVEVEGGKQANSESVGDVSRAIDMAVEARDQTDGAGVYNLFSTAEQETGDAIRSLLESTRRARAGSDWPEWRAFVGMLLDTIEQEAETRCRQAEDGGGDFCWVFHRQLGALRVLLGAPKQAPGAGKSGETSPLLVLGARGVGKTAFGAQSVALSAAASRPARKKPAPLGESGE